MAKDLDMADYDYVDPIDEVTAMVIDIISITDLVTSGDISQYTAADIEKIKEEMQLERDMYYSALKCILNRLYEIQESQRV